MNRGHRMTITNVNYGNHGRRRVAVHKNARLSTPWMVHQARGGNMFCASWDEAMMWAGIILNTSWHYAGDLQRRMLRELGT